MNMRPDLRRNEIKQIWNAWSSFEPQDGMLDTKTLDLKYRNLENCQQLREYSEIIIYKYILN